MIVGLIVCSVCSVSKWQLSYNLPCFDCYGFPHFFVTMNFFRFLLMSLVHLYIDMNSYAIMVILKKKKR
jgi:hypothetical protein